MLRARAHLGSFGRAANDLAVGRRRIGGAAVATATDWSGRTQQVRIGTSRQGTERWASSASFVRSSSARRRSSRMASNGAAVTTADAGGIEAKDEQQQQQQQQPVEGNGAESETAAAAAADAEHGFTRSEMHSQPLVGSVGYYERHIFLCYKDPKSWPSHVEAGDYDRLPRYLVAALRARKNDMPKKTRLTICEGRDGAGPDSSAGDVLIFPDMLRYRGLTHFDVDTFVEDVLVKGKEWVGSKPESLSGSHIFVCCHGSRDKRCGVCGPVLMEKLQEEINVRGLEGEVVVRPCSHIGGHKYAGNLIVYSAAGTDTVSGHWYGYVTPADVQVILDQHIGKGEIIDRLWRGEMGVGEADQKQAQQDRLGRLEEEKKGCACSESPVQADGANGQNGSACCQSNEPVAEPELNGVAYGQTPPFLQSTSPTAHDGHLIFLDEESSSDEETEPRINLWGSYYIPLPKWTETWEREDTTAVLSVLGAAAAVAVAFHLYRQSSSSA